MAVAAAALQSVGGIISGISQGESYHYQAQVAANNARIAAQNATYSAGAGSTNIETAELKAAQRSAGVKAGIAANNIDVNSGSASNVQVSQKEIGALESANEASRAAMNVYGYKTQQMNDTAQAKADEASASNAYIGAAISAVAPMLNPQLNLPQNFQWMGQNSEEAQLSSQASDELGQMTAEDASGVIGGGG